MADRKITELATLAAIQNNTIFTVVDPDEASPDDQNKKITGATLLNYTGSGGAGYTDQMARDAVGAMLADTDTIDQTYNSGTASMIFQVKRQMSIDYNASGIKLVGDVASPAANDFYAANGAGVRGWQTALTAFNKNFGTIAGTVAEGNHNHTGVYEPAFSKNTAFNKNFGTTSGTVAAGDHTHAGVYEPAFTKNSAFNKDFAGTGIATTVARSDHNHDSTYSALAHTHALNDLSNVTAPSPSTDQVLKFNGSAWVPSTFPAGVTTYAALTDGAGALAGNALKLIRVNSGGTTHEYVDGSTLFQPLITGAASSITTLDLTVNRALVSNASGKVGVSAVTLTELGYVSGVTSAIQTQINSKQATITGAATTITASNLSINRALISNGSGKVAVSAVTSTELGYLTGVTSSIQTQLNGKSATTHNHTGVYEPVFSKNTAFNKNFGTTAGTVAEGDHNHDAAYSPIGHDHNSLYVKLAGVSAMASGAHISYASQANDQPLIVGTNETSGTAKKAYIGTNFDNSTNIARVDIYAGYGANLAGISAILDGNDPSNSYSLFQGLFRYAGVHTFTNDRDIVDKAYVDSVVGSGGLSVPAAVSLNAPSPIVFEDLLYTDYAVTTQSFRFSSIFVQNPVNKRIMLVYRRATSHLVDGDLVMMRSATGGGDWEKNGSGKIIETVVATNDQGDFSGNDLRNVNGGYTKNGRLIISFVDYNQGADTFNDMYTMYTDDDGDTWSTPYAMPVVAGNTRWSPFGAIVEKWDFEQSAHCLYLPFNMRTTGGGLSDWHNLYLWRSFDNGETWLEADILNIIHNGVLGGTATTPTFDTNSATPLEVGHQRQNEPQIVHLGGDYLLVVARGYNYWDTDYAGGYQYLSSDGGQTWAFQGRTPFDMGSVVYPTVGDNYSSPATLSYLEYGGVGFVLAQVLNREAGTWYHVLGRADLIIENGVDGWDMLTYTALKDDLDTSQPHGYGGSVFFSNRFKGMVMTWVVNTGSIQEPIFRWVDEVEMIFHVDRLLGRSTKRKIELTDGAAITADCKGATDMWFVLDTEESAPAITIENAGFPSTINFDIKKLIAGDSIPVFDGTDINERPLLLKGYGSSPGLAISGLIDTFWNINMAVTGRIITIGGGGGEQVEDTLAIAAKTGVIAFDTPGFLWQGHAFQAIAGRKLLRIEANIYSGGSADTGNVNWYLYSLDPAYSVPDARPGSLLATGDNDIVASGVTTVDTNMLSMPFTGDQQYVFPSSGWYGIAISVPGAVSNGLRAGYNNVGDQHNGNHFRSADGTTWLRSASYDLIFTVYTEDAGVPVDNAVCDVIGPTIRNNLI